MSILIVCAIVTSAAIAIAGALTSRRTWYLLAKPLTMGLIIVLALQRDAAPDWQGWLLAALLLSLLGDILLMFPARGFVAGLFAFLLAHIAYIALFYRMSGVWWHPMLLPLSIAALFYWSRLWRYKPRLMAAIVLYTTVLLIMVTTALALAIPHADYLLMAGVLLFAFSDSVLGWNKFAQPIARAQLWILGSYFTAQTLIVLAL